MSFFRRWIKLPALILWQMVRRTFFHPDYDSSAYWRARAQQPRQKAVMWSNEAYTSLYREKAKPIIESILRDVPQNGRVLDIGCGIGVLAKQMASFRPDITVDAVDFPEMIARARSEVSVPNINFVESSAEDFFHTDHFYDLVISAGCFSAIRDIEKLKRAMRNAFEMTASAGQVFMIDPFHRWNYLARAKFSVPDVVRVTKQWGFVLKKYDGIVFWPFRDWLIAAKFDDAKLAHWFARGETLLRILGPRIWSDYRILLFARK